MPAKLTPATPGPADTSYRLVRNGTGTPRTPLESAGHTNRRGFSQVFQDVPQDQANLQARRDLWRNCLITGFPNVAKDPRGYGTGNKVRDLRKLRNRVSHMDSLLYVNVTNLHDNVLLPLLNSISHDLRDWVKDRSRVHEVLGRRPT